MKVGFIDYFLDEWHANHLVDWLKEESNGEVYVAYAYASHEPKDVPGFADRLSSADWAKQYGVELCTTVDELIEKSDVLMVLAPNHPETHEALADAALKSGKVTYIDKTFAPDVAAAQRLIDKGAKYGTPLFTTSALRYAKEVRELNKEGIESVGIYGAGAFEVYCIHQMEIAVTLLGAELRRVMAVGPESLPTVIAEFSGGRYAVMQQRGHDCEFGFAANYKDGKGVIAPDTSDYFPGFIRELVRFFETGKKPVPYEETMAVMKLRETALRAVKTPGVWLDVQ